MRTGVFELKTREIDPGDDFELGFAKHLRDPLDVVDGVRQRRHVLVLGVADQESDPPRGIGGHGGCVEDGKEPKDHKDEALHSGSLSSARL